VQGIGVDTTAEDFSTRRYRLVVCTGETGDGVEKNHDILLVLDKPLGFLYDHLGNLDVAACLLVEGGGDNLTVDVTPHIGHFFRPFINQKDHQNDFRMIGTDGVGDFLKQDSLACSRGGDDQGALAFTDGTEHIDDANRHILFSCLQFQSLIREKRSKTIKRNTHFCHNRLIAVDFENLENCKEAFILTRGAHLSIHYITGFQIQALDLGGRDIYVLLS